MLQDRTKFVFSFTKESSSGALDWDSACSTANQALWNYASSLILLTPPVAVELIELLGIGIPQILLPIKHVHRDIHQNEGTVKLAYKDPLRDARRMVFIGRWFLYRGGFVHK